LRLGLRLVAEALDQLGPARLGRSPDLLRGGSGPDLPLALELRLQGLQAILGVRSGALPGCLPYSCLLLRETHLKLRARPAIRLHARPFGGLLRLPFEALDLGLEPLLPTHPRAVLGLAGESVDQAFQLPFGARQRLLGRGPATCLALGLPAGCGDCIRGLALGRDHLLLRLGERPLVRIGGRFPQPSLALLGLLTQASRGILKLGLGLRPQLLARCGELTIGVVTHPLPLEFEPLGEPRLGAAGAAFRSGLRSLAAVPGSALGQPRSLVRGGLGAFRAFLGLGLGPLRMFLSLRRGGLQSLPRLRLDVGDPPAGLDLRPLECARRRLGALVRKPAGLGMLQLASFSLDPQAIRLGGIPLSGHHLLLSACELAAQTPDLRSQRLDARAACFVRGGRQLLDRGPGIIDTRSGPLGIHDRPEPTEGRGSGGALLN
jgi:hypothetical protein